LFVHPSRPQIHPGPLLLLSLSLLPYWIAYFGLAVNFTSFVSTSFVMK
jgi:hypothetical protein